jgi:hypothetical protein
MKPLRTTAFVLGVLAAFLLPAGGALAAEPVAFHNLFDETFEEELCGIPVIGHARGVDVFTIFFDNEGNVIRVMGRQQGVVTWTNPENEKTVSMSFAGSFRETRVENPDGTFTFTLSGAGVQENIFVSRADTLIKDVGRVTVVSRSR